jgi:HD-GYP domain-containing protein (c-di-GMP phosphodiesterase class II)
VLEKIRQEAGAHFDPDLTAAFLKIVAPPDITSQAEGSAILAMSRAVA